MHKIFINLFPKTINNGAIEIFGQQSFQPVLLKLLPVPMPLTGPILGLLHQNEVATLSGYKFPKRRSEYLTGRICAKMAVHELLNQTSVPSNLEKLSAIQISNTENGRPVACFDALENNTPKMDISITHSGDYGAALTAGSPCGIDLQLRQDSLLKVKEKYCSQDEFRLLETLLPETDTLTRLALLWAAKEAAKKALSHWQMPGFLDLEMSDLKNFTHYTAFTVQVTNIKNQVMPQKVTIIAGMFKEHALAICLMNRG